MVAKTAMALIIGLLIGGFGVYTLTKDNPVQRPVAAVDRKDITDCFIDGKNEVNLGSFSIGSTVYTFKDLPLDVQAQLVQSTNSISQTRSQILKEAALRLAQSGVTSRDEAKNAAPLKEQLKDQITFTDKDIEEYYKTNRRTLPNMPLPKLKPTIENFLITSKLQIFKRQLERDLDEKGFDINTEVNCMPAMNIDYAALPSVGAKDPAFKILMFTDFFCAKCRTQWSKLSNNLKNNQTKNARVYFGAAGRDKDYGVGEMNRSLFCASEQGPEKLVAFLNEAHKLDMNIRKNLGQLRAKLTKTAAPQAELDLDAFAKCLTSNEAKEFTANTKVLAETLGIRSAPRAVINNRIVVAGETETMFDILADVTLN